MASRGGGDRWRRGQRGADGEERRIVANIHRNRERRQQRDLIHRANRGLQEAEPTPAPQPAAAPQPEPSMREKLKAWQAKRALAKEVEKAKKQRPAFKSAGANHPLPPLPFKPPEAKNKGAAAAAAAPTPAPARPRVQQPARTARPAAAPAGRVTRAAAARTRQPPARQAARPAAAAAAAPRQAAPGRARGQRATRAPRAPTPAPEPEPEPEREPEQAGKSGASGASPAEVAWQALVPAPGVFVFGRGEGPLSATPASAAASMTPTSLPASEPEPEQAFPGTEPAPVSEPVSGRSRRSRRATRASVTPASVPAAEPEPEQAFLGTEPAPVSEPVSGRSRRSRRATRASVTPASVLAAEPEPEPAPAFPGTEPAPVSEPVSGRSRRSRRATRASITPAPTPAPEPAAQEPEPEQAFPGAEPAPVSEPACGRGRRSRRATRSSLAAPLTPAPAPGPTADPARMEPESADPARPETEAETAAAPAAAAPKSVFVFGRQEEAGPAPADGGLKKPAAAAHVRFAAPFQPPEGVEAHVFRTPGKAPMSYRKTPCRRRPPAPSDSSSESETFGTPASCIDAAIAEFRHIIDSPWITLHRGSSSKKRRREQEEERRRQRAAIRLEESLVSDEEPPQEKRPCLSLLEVPQRAGSASSGSVSSAAFLSAREDGSEPTAESSSATETASEAEEAEGQRPGAAAGAGAGSAEDAAGMMETERAAEQPTAATGSGEEDKPRAAAAGKPAVKRQPEPGPELSIGYFRRLLASETARLEALAGRWEALLAGDSLPAEALGEIRSVSGQARLLIRERFLQFEGLVDSAEFLRGPRPTTLTDLQGFWEMVNIQVEDVDRKFERLSAMQSAGWVPEQPGERSAPRPAAAAAAPARARKPAAPRQPAASKKAGPSSGLRAAMMAARKRMQAEGGAAETPVMIATATSPAAQAAAAAPAPPAEPAPLPAAGSPERQFAGGFFTVASPAVVPSPAAARDSAARLRGAEQRRSVLLAATRRLSDLSPLVRVSASAKLAQRGSPPPGSAASGGLTPYLPARAVPAAAAAQSPALAPEEITGSLPKRRRTSRRRSGLPLSELSDNTPVRPRRVSARPSLLGDCLPESPPPPLGEDLMSFDSPAPRRLRSRAGARN